jgi:hypothetical protein
MDIENNSGKIITTDANGDFITICTNCLHSEPLKNLDDNFSFGLFERMTNDYSPIAVILVAAIVFISLPVIIYLEYFR